MGNKVVLITGGSRGIGKAIAHEFAKNNYDIALNYASNETAALAVAEELASYNVQIKLYKANIANVEDVANMINQIKEDYQKIDVLVNNAGICIDNLLIRQTADKINQVLDINLKGTIFVSQAVSKLMMRQKSGSIINMASVIGEVGNITQSIYGASKAGVIGFTKSLAKELATRGIRVNAIAPGFIKTDMTDKLSDDVKENILKQIPLHCFGQAENVADMALFLASDKATYITGQIINVDGGMVM